MVTVRNKYQAHLDCKIPEQGSVSLNTVALIIVVGEIKQFNLQPGPLSANGLELADRRSRSHVKSRHWPTPTPKSQSGTHFAIEFDSAHSHRSSTEHATR